MESCPKRYSCPHLGFQGCAEVLAEKERLQHQLADTRHVLELGVQAFAQLKAENQRLKEESDLWRARHNELSQQPFHRQNNDDSDTPATSEITSPPPSKPERRRGAPLGHYGATRPKPDQTPDRTTFVVPRACPKCASTDISLGKSRQFHTVEDIFLPRKTVELFIKPQCRCRSCGHLFFPKHPNEIPHSRIGATARAFAGFLRYSIKIPFEGVRSIFWNIWRIKLTNPALTGFDHKLAQTGRPVYETIHQMVRSSNAVNIDETSWPEGERLKWLWTCVNQDLVFFTIDTNRSSAVLQKVLGEHYQGTLISDCFSAYNPFDAIRKQKCLTHYERDATDIQKFHPQDAPAHTFATTLKDLFKRARQVKRDWLAGKISDSETPILATAFENELDVLLTTPFTNHDADCLRLRLIAHRNENFTFLRFKEVEPDNNRAERALRPSVVMRKITYGTNSTIGSFNHETLMTLVETAKARNMEALAVMTALAKGAGLAELNAMFFNAGQKPEENTLATERAPPAA